LWAVKTKLTCTGDGVAFVLDPPLLEELGLGDDAEVELITNEGVLVVRLIRAADTKFRESAEKIAARYAGLFRRLSE
jgi:hypothetical protein